MQELGSGPLARLHATLGEPVAYALPLGEALVPLNGRLGQRLRIEFRGLITCSHCGRRSKRSFGQGYCYPCFQRLARCDSCIVKPENCHFAHGTCREPEWGARFCMTEHIVYLANSSGLKVGITRASQLPTRWIDQGAVQALPLLRVATRHQSGLAEVLFARSVADKTNWRAMLREPARPLDLAASAVELLERHRAGLDDLRSRFGPDAIQPLPGAATLAIGYPVLAYPPRPQSISLDRTPCVEGVLLGIKGQYLILDCGVLNVRNFTAYHVQLSAAA